MSPAPRLAQTPIEVEVEDDAWREALPQVEDLVRRAALAGLAGGRTGEVVVLLTDDESMRDLNRHFRGKDAPTNVLSFPAAGQPGARLPEGAGQEAPLGDIALALGVCRAEALAGDIALADHLSHLVIHGVLHLLGYDHLEDDQAEVMEALEVERLAALGVADPYRNSRPEPALKEAPPHD